MVTRESVYIPAEQRARLGTVLIWMGVLAWAPFIVMRIAGYTPSLLWFLPFHLLGVVGGSRLRSAARKEMGYVKKKKTALRTVGHSLLFIGIMVWVPYFYLKLFTQTPVEVTQFLPVHLFFVLSGITLLVISSLLKRKQL